MKKYFYKSGNHLIISFWIVAFFIWLLQIIPQTESVLEAVAFSMLLSLSAYPATRYLSENLLVKAIKEKKVKPFIFQFIFFSFLIGFLVTIYLYLFSYLELIGIFPPSEYFNLDHMPAYVFLVPLSAGLLLNICVCGLRFFLEYVKSQKIILEYQLRTLQHQVTPHFMFNVLNHIHILMQSDVELASELLIKYSDILRYQLYNGEKENVTLEQDIQFLKDFITVEEFRWGDKLTVNCSWKIEDGEKKIPALLFITFIENAFKYVSKTTFEKGSIHIDFEQQGNMLRLEVENSKSVIPAGNDKPCGLGLRNIKERLEILYYGKYNLLIKETDSVYQIKLVINI